MERKEWIDGCRRLFTRLVRTTVWADFVFPTGGKSDRQLGMCFDGLCREVVSVSAERLSDFCICQTYAISGYDTAYRRKWNVSHSFGKKAIGRYLRSGKERRYREDGSRSLTAFIERAVDFYLDYLSANNAGLFLPTSIKSYLDGRLGQMEERLSSLAFRQAVEQDMVAGILADAYQFSDEDLRRRRAESVQNVKKTNGRISLEQRVRGAWEEGDEWQD